MIETVPTQGPAPSSNLPEFSVSEVSGAVKRVLETAFSRIRVRGEITEFKRYPSGHLYFSLKDEGGKISGVVWRNSVAKLGLQPENGLEVIATGRISSYGERSSYQLIVERMDYAGEGALLARIERLRLKLAAEGLFDTERKRRLPFLPALIGLVTSPQGAVLHDIRTTIARRFPRSLMLWPVPVQGEGAAARIAAAIEGFDRRTGPGTGLPRPDLLIVARGGGSLEDLAAFSDEAVLRAAAACTIPLISAVGHETDTTLIDFVSDRRAPTPTAAAEIAVPARLELLADLSHRAARLEAGLGRLLETARARHGRAAAALPDLPTLLNQMRQRLDDRAHRLELSLPGQLEARRTTLRDLGHRLGRALPGLVTLRRSALLAAERHLPDPHRLIEQRRGRLADAALRLDRSRAALFVPGRQALAALERRMPDPERLIERNRGRLALSANGLQSGLRHVLRDASARGKDQRNRLAVLSAQLEAVSPLAVLARGYVLVRDRDGHAVTEAAALRTGARLELRFADGSRAVRVEPDAAAQGALPL
ncbi:exodeoxyribonuclease VII large subunit [Acetobacteraceae bacterium KSS8]|uniref:Exodeoxyribonuclease 7 large subunit n=1 Tax=Endosaccharibacter trunci TaxID=2812733 RepID=A0ABT1W333_9PROT|nr:exodeoxyribonuclease VII large subunit [Acetobacteraceae bacterium KSS8]